VQIGAPGREREPRTQALFDLWPQPRVVPRSYDGRNAVRGVEPASLQSVGSNHLPHAIGGYGPARLEELPVHDALEVLAAEAPDRAG